ncbi:unnamed protein product [Closterium sp. NIES-65]|nr:unnamed protein product [Closterium sp. NIES-65]
MASTASNYVTHPCSRSSCLCCPCCVCYLCCLFLLVAAALPPCLGPPNPPSPPHPFACSHLCSACVSTTALAHAAPKSSLWGRSAEELVLRRSRGGKARRAEEGLG